MVGEADRRRRRSRPRRCSPRSSSISAAPPSGRGYGSGEASGDNGVQGAFELLFDHGLNYAWLKGYQLYGFLEGGTVWNYGFAPRDGLSLASIGAGVRVYLTDDLQAGVGVAFPLDYRSPDNPQRHARVLFRCPTPWKSCPDKARLACGLR